MRLGELTRACHFENALNNLIADNYTVTTSWISDEELLLNPALIKTLTVKPPLGTGKVRLVKIGNQNKTIDLQPCGGTHVSQTSEVGQVEFGKIDDEFKPVLSDKEDYLLRQSVNINLNIAQLSLLRGNNEIFRESLAEAQETLISHFQLNEELDSIHADLKALDDVLIEKQGPSLSMSLSRVRDSINKVADQELH